jgi:SHS2 domain-containing protein
MDQAFVVHNAPTVRVYSRNIEHEADCKLAIHADTLEEVFAVAADAVARSGAVRRGVALPYTEAALTATDLPALLADWINELLYLSERNSAAYACVGVSVVGSSLTAQLQGRRVRQWRAHFKAATYHGLRLEQSAGRWRAQVVVDV